MIGARVRRVEDPRLLRGRGEYVDDLPTTGALHIALVRSTYARADIGAIDSEAAAAMRGVVAIVTGASLGERNGPFPHPTWFPANAALSAEIDPTLHPESIRLLAVGRTRFAGEPIAAVVATDRYAAEDAARRIVVDYAPLPVLTDPERALDDDAPLVQEERGTNLAAHFTVRKGNVDPIFADAAHVVEGEFRMGRQTGVPIEARGTVAVPDRRGGLTVWSSTQAPHWLRDALVRCFGLSEGRLRVVAPDVGGGFGVKSMVYPEELLVAALALQLGRPVRWTDTRRESFLSGIHSRSQRHRIALALDADGRILALRDAYLVDAGSSNVEALVVPYNTTAHLQSIYRIPAVEIECTVVLTNKAPLSAYRGAGRPEAVFAMERILDRAARQTGIDPMELRRINAVRADEMPYDAGIPYRDGQRLVVDGGDFPKALEMALESAGYASFRDEQATARAAGRHIGIGIAGYIEGTGVGPFETAQVRVTAAGDVVVEVALPSQGQGHETILAQICAEALGVPMSAVQVVAGDTLSHAWGGGTIASRTAVVVGNAVMAAATEVRDHAARLASDRLEVAVTDLVFEGGRVFVAGSPDRGFGLGQLAVGAAPGAGRSGGAEQVGLRAERAFQPPMVTFASGIHVALVEVDIETGAVRIDRYIVVHDCGRLINPLIVEGQIQGGIAQGIGGALFEELIYDETGQLVSGTLMDYGMPRSTDIPDVEMHHLETPSARNPLGVKGVGEAGTIAVPAAIIGAVEDALEPFGAEIDSCPLTPERIRGYVLAAGGEGSPTG